MSYIMQRLPQERRNSAMREYTGGEGAGGRGGSLLHHCHINHADETERSKIMSQAKVENDGLVLEASRI